MNLLSDYKTISEDTIKKVFEISDAAEESVHYVEEAGMKYGIIKNFYTDPSAVKNFIRENFALIDVPVTNSPGVQLYFNQSFNNSLSHVMEYFHGILMKHYFPASQEKMFKVPIWETYVNFYWKNMKAKLPNIIPHVDEFNYGFNCWITEDIPSGTDFYTYKWRNYRPVYTINEFRDIDAGKYMQYMQSLCEVFHDESDIDWDPDKHLDPEVWNKYHTIEPEYNTVTYYPGIFFHMPSLSPSYEENFLRMSQVYTYQCTDSQHFQNMYKNFKTSKYWREEV